MKFHRVEAKLPAGVSPCIGTRITPSLDGFFGFEGLEHVLDKVTLSRTTERHTSTDPIKITLDVPEAAATETARVLRAMADELDGGRK